MNAPNALDQSFAPLQASLHLRAQRQQLLTANIVNADTPGYKAVDLDFQKALDQALGQAPQSLAMKATHPRHLPGDLSPAGGSAIGFQQGNPVRLDGNSVDLDREQAEFQKNSIHYEADLTFLGGKIKSLLSAITGN